MVDPRLESAQLFRCRALSFRRIAPRLSGVHVAKSQNVLLRKGVEYVIVRLVNEIRELPLVGGGGVGGGAPPRAPVPPSGRRPPGQ